MGRRQIDSEPTRWVPLGLLLMGLFSCFLVYMFMSVILRPSEKIQFLSVSENESAELVDNNGGCCRGMDHFELWGAAVKWGTDFKFNSSVECCDACKAMCNGKDGPCLCDSWVFCGNPDACGSKYGECWLKKQKDPLAPDKQDAGDDTIWTSGLIYGKGEGIVKMETQYGTLHIKLLPECAPRSVMYILELLTIRHCAGCQFYRAEGRGQSWDSEGNHLNSAPFGPPFALVQGTLEAEGVLFKKIPTEECPIIQRGSVAWIGSGPEFFISLANHEEWKKSYTVFGYVLPEDMEIAEKIATLPTVPDVWTPCQRFTPNLIDVYNELADKGDFEIVFISADEDEESFKGYFSKMPWLAVPHSDTKTREALDGCFKVSGIPHLVFLDESGKVLTDSGVMIVGEYGSEGYPFTPERVKEIKDQEEEARKNQSLRTILESPSRNYVITANGDKVFVTDLEGKTVGLYFMLSTYKKSSDFTGTLVKVYNELKAKGENFEIVMIPLDDNEESFNKEFSGLPWLSLPFKDKKCEKLVRYFELSTLPTLVVIGPDGKTLHPNVADAVDEHGVIAYPFTPDKFAELEKIEKAKQEAQTLESVLVSGDLDFVLGKDGKKIPVSDLVGKHILLYFSAHWCPPCRAFTPKLVETYHEIKTKHEAFEVIFISSDRDQASYDEYYSTMPWLSLPFGDKRKQSLSRLFKVNGIPLLAALGPTGKTITTETRSLIMLHGAEAFPFTDERMAEIEAKFADLAKDWPNKVKHAMHPEHELVLTRSQRYTCDGCDKEGKIWAYNCEDCNFDLHPDCALKETNGKDEVANAVKEDEKPNEGWVCDGDVCHKAS